MKLLNNDVILFQGDSITHGGRCTNEDLNHVMGHGYQAIVGAKLCADNLDKNIKVFNRGISGNRIADLYGRWVEDTLLLKPTILSILVGVNDAGFAYRKNLGMNTDRYEKIYRLMLDEAREQNPDMRLILMEPFKGEIEEDEKRDFIREYIKSLQDIVKKLSEEYDAVFVPLQDMFDTYAKKVPYKELIWDGTHPTIVGHELIARQWLKAIKED